MTKRANAVIFTTGAAVMILAGVYIIAAAYLLVGLMFAGAAAWGHDADE